MNREQYPHVVVVGGGFGGLQVVRSLKREKVKITLIDRNNYHLFQPLLYQVATAVVSSDEIAYPLRATLRKQANATVCLAEVKQVNLAEKWLQTNHGKIDYDYLVLAAGGRTNFYGLETVESHAFGLKDLQDAARIRNHILCMFEIASHQTDPEMRKALLTFVIVGGGPTGVECAGAISELIHLVLRKDYPDIDSRDVHVLLVEMTDRLLPAMPPALSQNTLKTLQGKNIDVVLEQTVAAFDGESVTFRNGEVIPARTLIWAAGIRPASIFDTLDVEKASSGALCVLPTMQLPAYPEVFAVGDAVWFEQDGSPLPMVAPVAIQQGQLAAGNLSRLIQGRDLESFRYKDHGIMATIGRNQAVARIGKLQISGFPAWLVWLIVHILQLIGFRNRIIVLINWIWDYFFYERAVRIIGPE